MEQTKHRNNVTRMSTSGRKNKYANKLTKHMLLDMKCIILANMNVKLLGCTVSFHRIVWRQIHGTWQLEFQLRSLIPSELISEKLRKLV